MDYDTFHRQSVDDPQTFWAQQAKRIAWHTPPEQVLDYSRPPFARWFAGGTTNLCYNAVDRWAETQPAQPALISVSTETDTERVYTYAELLAEVQRMAAVMRSLGVSRGDRVLIYMPMIPQAVFAMLACARIGAIHSVVFGGFASNSLASRIDDARPRLVVSADAGSRSGKVMPYKPLLDDAIDMASHKPTHVLLVDRGLAPMTWVDGRDIDYGTASAAQQETVVPVTWLDATESSYILYTSGTTGRPKGVQRDVGGYAVALAASMDHIYCGKPGETFFCTSDIGWVVGHSYIVYGPLLAGMATVLYEGLPVRPDAGIWWRIVQDYRVTRMFSAPTAVRVLKKHPVDLIRQYDISSLKSIFLAGEPLDESTSAWVAEALRVPVIDNYWQTETGWPILSIARGVDEKPTRLGSPGVPMAGYRVKILNETTGEVCGSYEKGVVVIEGPLPPGCMQTVWGDDARFVDTYWSNFIHPGQEGQPSRGEQIYSTFDWGIRDADGYYFILGRTDDVINVAGHRLGTREIEESISSHPNVSEVAVVGVEDSIKGQVAVAFVIPKHPEGLVDEPGRQQFEADIMRVVDRQLGAVARPARVHVVQLLPKTRSGKLLRRAIQAICEGRNPGDLPTIEDPTALQQVQDAVARR